MYIPLEVTGMIAMKLSQASKRVRVPQPLLRPMTRHRLEPS